MPTFLSSLHRAQITEMKSLRIERLVASDDGVYVCEGKNDVGSVEAAARLTIHSQPSFSVMPTDQTVGAHRSVTFKVIQFVVLCKKRFQKKKINRSQQTDDHEYIASCKRYNTMSIIAMMRGAGWF